MTTKRRVLGGVSAFTLGCLALVASALPSSAVEQDVILALSDGTIDIEATSLSLPNNDPAGEGTTVFQGTWDDETGEVAGTLSVPVIATQSGDPGSEINIDIAFTQLSGGTGNIDPTTGLGTIDVTIEANISSPDAGIGDLIGTTCTIGPIVMTLDVVADFLATPPTFDMTATGFTVPQATGCGAGGALDAVVNSTLGISAGGTTNTSAVLAFAQTNELPEPPTTTTTTAPPPVTVAPSTPSAAPVQAQPTFTG